MITDENFKGPPEMKNRRPAPWSNDDFIGLMRLLDNDEPKIEIPRREQ
jgi:hypothetical protein